MSKHKFWILARARPAGLEVAASPTCRFGLVIAFLSVMFGLTAQPAWPQTLATLFSFNGTDGQFPMATLVRDSKGNLYGPADQGGLYGCGAIFEVTPSGTGKALYNFTGGADGCLSVVPLVLGPHGSFYAATSSGTIFELSKDGVLTVLHTLTGEEGSDPIGLLRDAKGNLYGTALNGGAYGRGTVFELTPSGTLTVLHSFAGGTDGANPEAGLVRDAKGNLFGTTLLGGGCSASSLGCGTVFEISSTGAARVLYAFTGGADGALPQSTLILHGNLYGTAQYGGTGQYPYGGWGTVFEVSRSGKEKVLYAFGSGEADGCYPSAGLVRDKSGNLYGTTENCGYGAGTVFAVTPAGTETVLHRFSGAEGALPVAGLVQDKQGNLYGATREGGGTGCGGSGCGTVFEVTP